MSDETLAQVLNEARDGRPYQLIHERLKEAGCDVSYQGMRAWFVGLSQPSVKHIGPLFDALNMDDAMRTRSIEAAR